MTVESSDVNPLLVLGRKGKPLIPKFKGCLHKFVNGLKIGTKGASGNEN